MVTTKIAIGPLTLICLTLLHSHAADYSLLNSAKNVAMGLSFGIILPTSAGIGVHFIENNLGLERHGKWSADDHRRIEATRLMNTCILGIITTSTWLLLNGTCAVDMRLSCALMSAYCYGQGRAFFMQRQSSLQNGSSYLFPAALGILAYNRIPDLAPQFDIAVKSLLVFGFYHGCGM